MEKFIDINEIPFPLSPVQPSLIEGDAKIQFQCHKGITCFNACCKNIDISLTPYDILRLKHRLNMTSSDFLVKYTIPYELEKQSLAGVKLLPVENGTACQFMTEEGCSVYEDRPTACRYYPVALLSMRKQNEYTEREAYAMVKEEHCLGHFEPRTLTINEYRKEQGVEEYDEHGKGWRQLVLKKKSSGPSIGNPSKRSLQLFFMACYDIDNFRKFVMSDSFNEVYDLSPEIKAQLQNDEIALMNFGFQLIRHVMFNEPSIPMKADALDKRVARKKEREEVLDGIVQKLGPMEQLEPEDKYKHLD